jgi:hypothetical protein
MSQIAMTVIDARSAVHGTPHGSFTDRAVGALAAEPETIAEFEMALKRFPDGDHDHPLAGWHEGICEEPYDAGICIIDLSARIVFLESTYSHAGHQGSVLCRCEDKEFYASYHVADHWDFSQNVLDWEAEAEAGRRRHLAEQLIDTRHVLYGAVCPFLVDECFAARNELATSGDWTPPEGWALRALPERAREDDRLTIEDGIAEIHARWLMTPRTDLNDRSPREMLLARHDHINSDLSDRCHQWSMTGECPQPLSRDSMAYRHAGFGTHEMVAYYELVRYLAWECWGRVVEPQEAGQQVMPEREKEVRHLEQATQDWLNSPNVEDFTGTTPALVIENERRRIPWVVSGKEAMVDDDCPLCQMLAESAGPVFCHLDGCNTDIDFPFSWHTTREEWEKEQREWAELDRKFDESEQVEGGGPPDTPGHGNGSSVWQQSASNTDPRTTSPLIVLFGLACHVAELEQDLKTLSDTPDLAGSVNHYFGNLRNVIDTPSPELIEPVVARFCEQLQIVGDTHPQLSEKCLDLQRQSRELAVRFSEAFEPDDELPF